MQGLLAGRVIAFFVLENDFVSWKISARIFFKYFRYSSYMLVCDLVQNTSDTYIINGSDIGPPTKSYSRVHGATLRFVSVLGAIPTRDNIRILLNSGTILLKESY